MPANTFLPDGWDHLAKKFFIFKDRITFTVRRTPHGTITVCCRGIIEEFSSAAQAGHHIRLLAREIEKQ